MREARRAHDASLAIVEYQQAHSTRPVDRAGAYVVMLLDGAYDESGSHGTLRFAPMSIAAHPPRYPAGYRVGDAGALLFVVEFDDVWQERIAPDVDIEKLPVQLRGGRLAWIGLRLFKAFIEAPALDTPDIDALLRELLIEAARATN
jgi:hypothetical protein